MHPSPAVILAHKTAPLRLWSAGRPKRWKKFVRSLKSLGKTITHVGESGAGQIAKAANQIMVAAQMVAMSELFIFAQKAGGDPQKVVQAIRGGAAQCWTLDVKPQRLFAGNRQPGLRHPCRPKT